MKTHPDRKTHKLVPRDPVIRDYFAVLWRGRWIIIWTCVAALAAAFVLAKFRQPSYKATASVLIDTKQSIQTLFLTGLAPGSVKNPIQNELEILRSQSLAETVARRLVSKMYLDSAALTPITIIQPADKDKGRLTVASVDQIVFRLQGAVDFVPGRESDIIKITAASVKAEEAALIANTYTRSYYDRNVYKSREKSSSVRVFLDSQLDEKRRVLEQAEASLQKYMERRGIVSLDEEAKKTIEQLSQLEATRDAADISLRALQQTMAAYEVQFPQQERIFARSVIGTSDPYIHSIQEQISMLEVQRDVAVVKNPLAASRGIYNEKLGEIEEQIRQLRQHLQKKTEEYLQSLVPAVTGPEQSSPAAYLRHVKQKMLETQIEIQSLQARRKALDEAIKQYENEFERIPGKNIEYARLQRSRLANEKLFLALTDRYNEATIAEQSQFGYIDIIDEAPVPLFPGGLGAIPLLFLGGVAGIMLGAGFVIVREFRDARVQSPEDLQRHGLAPVAVILRMDDELEKLKKVAAPASSGRSLDDHLICLRDPFSPIAESYRKLRTNVSFDRVGLRKGAILVTSPNPAEGKTTTTANLGISFAQSGKSVLIIDANLRRPSQATLFDLPHAHGLSEMIAGRNGSENIVQRSGIRNLHILSAGSYLVSPSEMLGSRRMERLVEQAKAEYDIVLFDTPPVLAVTDASIMATFADRIIMIVNSGATRMEEVERANRVLESVGKTEVRVLLNNFDPVVAYGLSHSRTAYMYYGNKDYYLAP